VVGDRGAAAVAVVAQRRIVVQGVGDLGEHPLGVVRVARHRARQAASAVGVGKRDARWPVDHVTQKLDLSPFSALAARPVGIGRGDAGHAIEVVVGRGVDLALMVGDGLLNEKHLHVPNQ